MIIHQFYLKDNPILLNIIIEDILLELKGFLRPGYIEKDEVNYRIYNFHGDFKSNLLIKEFDELLNLGLIEQLTNTKWVLSKDLIFKEVEI